MKHTKGPWIFYKGDDGKTLAVFDSRNDPRHTVVDWMGFDSGNGQPFSKQVANAKLIAAAPELLEALESLVVAAYNIGGEHVDGLEILEKYAAKAEAAIAKAKS